MEIAGKKDLAESGLTISKSGVRKIHISWSEQHKSETNGDRW